MSTPRSPRTGWCFVLFAGLLLAGGCDNPSLSSAPRKQTEGLGLPDYTITAADSSAAPIDDLDTATFKVIVQNVGGPDDIGALVSMYVDGIVVTDTIVAPRATLGAIPFTFKWPAKAGAHTITFTVDEPEGQIQWVTESNEQNNSASIELSVPIRERQIVQRDSLSFSQVPTRITTAAAVQQVLTIAADSGFAVPAGSMTHRTSYDGGGVTTYVTPLGHPDSPLNSIPILVVTETPGEEAADTVIYAYVFTYIDSVSSIVYDANGAVRVFTQGDSTQLISSFSGLQARGALAATSGCSEPWRPVCLQELGLTGLACVGSVALLAASSPGVVTTVGTLALALAACAGTAYAANKCAEALINNPPKIYVQAARTGRRCYKCEGWDQIEYTYDGWRARGEDDRGDVDFTLSGDVFSPGCTRSSFKFIARDCNGKVATRTVWAMGRRIRREVNGCHSQGAGANVLLGFAPWTRTLTSPRCQTELLKINGDVGVAAG